MSKYILVEVELDYDYIQSVSTHKVFDTLREATEYLNNLNEDFSRYMAELEECNKKTFAAYRDWERENPSNYDIGGTGILFSVPNHITAKFPRPVWDKPNPSNLYLVTA